MLSSLLPAGRVRFFRNQLLVAASALLLVTCTDNPTGPTVGGTVHLAVSPRFKAGVVLSPALPVDQARLVLSHQPDCDCSADSVAGATAPFALTQDSIQMQLSFTLQQSPETLEVHFDLLGAGQVLFSGDTTVIIRAGVPATVPPLSVYYYGPGSDIYFLSLSPQDTVLTFGDSLQFQVSASNAEEVPETAFYVGWSSSHASVRIGPDGTIHAPSQRLTDTVTVQTPSTSEMPDGVTRSTTITFVPKPVSLAKVSGDTQTASINDTLPLPLRVRVKAADSLGVAGVRVVFHPLGLAGPAVPDTVYTDSLGFAQVRAVLGDSVGAQQWQAAVTGLSSVTFTATSQVIAGPPFKLHVVTQPADSQVNGALVVPPMVLQVEDSAGIPVHQAGIAVDAQTWSWLDGAPRPTRKLARAAIHRAGTAGPYLSAYAFGTLTDSTDANGRVTFAALRLTGYGDDRVVFNSAGLVADTSIYTFVKEGPPKNLQKASADSTSSYVDSLVSTVPAVWVYDTTYNPVPHAAVVFQVTAGGGQLPQLVDTVFTDSTGYAQLASWRLGSTPGTNSVQATVAGAGSLTFTAFAQPPVPTVLLQLQGTSVIGVGRTATLLIHLSSPAGAGGDSVLVSSDNTGIVSVAGPGIFVAAGDSIGSIVLNGVAAGTDTIRATATGYIAGALGVTASINLISLPATLTVPFGGTTAVGVTLAAPAPAGGVVVTLVSSDSTKVQVLTPTVSFAQGVQTQNGQIGGVALGTATVTASNPNYSSASTTVTTAANLNIVAATATIYPAFPDSQTIQFLSSGTPIAAPAGGILVALAAADSTCVSVPATVPIIGGLSTAKFPVSYTGTKALPCTSYVVATASGVGPDSILMTVAKPPTISASPFDVGASLENSMYVSFQTPIQGSPTMTIRPLKVGVARFAPNATTVGVDTLIMPLVNGTSGFYVTVAGMDTVTNDSTYFEVSVPGYATDTALVRVRLPGVQIYSVPTSTTSLSATTPIYAEIGVTIQGGTTLTGAEQAVRAGHAPLLVSFHVDPGTFAQMTDSSGVFDTVVTVQILPGTVGNTPTSLSSGGVGYHPIAAGTTVSTVTIPGFVTNPSYSFTTTTITTPTFTASAPTVGSGLQTSFYVPFSAPAPAGSMLTVTSLNPSVLLVADSISHVGADSIKVPLGTLVNYTYVYVSGLEGVVNDSSQLVLSIPGYKTDTVWGHVHQAGIVLSGLQTTTTTFTAKTPFYASIGLPCAGNSGMCQNEAIRAGAPPLTVTFHTSQAAIGTLTDSSLVQDTVRTAVIPVNPASGIYYTPTTLATGGVAYQPVGPGQSKTWATLPGFVTLPLDTVKTTVSAPLLGASPPSVGAGLQTSMYVSLGAATPAPTTMTVKSLNPAITVVSDTATKVGADSVVIPLGVAIQYQYVYVSGLEGVINDSTRLVLSVPGYTSDTVWSYVRQAGVLLAGVNTNTTTLSDSNQVYAEVGLPYVGNSGLAVTQAIRAGSAGATFLIKPSDPTVQRMVTTGGQADSAVVLMAAGQYYSPFTLATGGAALKVLTTGIDTVRVTGAGFVPVTGSAPVVTVSAPAITVNAVTVGAGLAVNGYATLGASQHGGDTVTVWSSNPGVALVAPNATTPGTDSIRVFVANGYTSVPFYVIGVDSTVGTPIIYASANGFNQGSATATVVQPVVEMSGPTASQTAGGADNPFYAYIGIPYSGTNTFYSNQIRAAGKPAFTVTFTSSAPSVGTLTTTGLTAGVVTAVINVGLYYTPTTVGLGGTAFRPLTTGTSTVSATIPGFLQTVNATGEVVTVH